MNTVPLPVSAKPNLKAWTLALLGISLTSSLALCVLCMGSAWREQLLYARLSDQLQFREYSKAAPTLADLTAPPRILKLARSIPLLPPPRSSGDLYNAKILLSALLALSVNRIDDARSRLATLPAGSEPLLAPLQHAAVSIAEIQRRIDLAQSNLEGAQLSLRTNDSQAGLIAKDFADTLGLEPDLDPSGFAEPYSDGILKGLPRMKRLRDTIADLTFLKVELDALGASVKVEGSNPHETFIAKLEKLRAAYDSIVMKREESELALENISDGLAQTQRELVLKRAGLENETRNMILNLSRPADLPRLFGAN